MADLPHVLPPSWDELDWRAVNTARVLAADAVQRTGNGHPGTAMSLAPIAYHLYQKVMAVNPADTHWVGRDRFLLSCGHTSLTQYLQLFLGGFGLEMTDLEALRTWGSKTPGHPEYRHTDGVETSTGPLGQGVGNAVGMAMAARRERGIFDADAAPGESVFDHDIYVIASDGDMEEGLSGEASSLAGTQQLGNLTLIWDDNHISIEDDTKIAFSEDVIKRYDAYGWHTQLVDWTATGEYVEDVAAFAKAIDAARRVKDKPSFIAVRTIIGYPTPKLMGTGKAHGAALGDEAVAAVKKVLGFDPEKSFQIDPEVLAHARELKDRGAKAQAAWEERFQAWRKRYAQRAQLLDRLEARGLPDGWDAGLPSFPADPKGVATRAASGKTLTALAQTLPELWGGSADLAGSNNTTPEGQPSFLPDDRQSGEFKGGPYGRVLHFGIREHAMGAILNGITQHGLTRPYGGTFLVFSDYMRPAVRLAAFMKLPTIYVWTHDSIGVGEDGPTHQPIEHLSALRAIPGLDVVRPADANETVAAWRTIMQRTDNPHALVLSRQNLPTFPRDADGFAPASDTAKGAYVLKDCDGTPDVILIATGSEVQLAVAAQELLAKEDVLARVVSAPCLEWFEEQGSGYREQVLPQLVKARVSVEAGIAMSWRPIIGDAGRAVSIEHYGASASGEVLFREFGFTPEHVVEAAKASITAAKGS